MKSKLFSGLILSIFLLSTPTIVNAQLGGLFNRAKKGVKKATRNNKSEKDKQEEKTPVQEKKQTEMKEEKTTQEKAPVQGKTEVNHQQNTRRPEGDIVERKGGNQHSKLDLHSFYLGTVDFFLTDLMDNFMNGRRFPQPVRRYDSKDTNPPYTLYDAIPVVNDSDFPSKKWVKTVIEYANNPKYIEERYTTIDYAYKSETDYREKYPTNTDPRQGEYGKTKDLYDVYKIIQKYIVKNNPDFDAEVAYVKKKVEKINAKFEARLDAIAINDVHKANLYKIIFTSNSKINPQTAPTSEYKTTFKPGEEIFAVAMVDKPLNNNIVKQAYAQVEMKSGVDIIETVVEHQMFPIKPNQKYFVFPIVVKSTNFKCSNTEATANTEYGMRWLSQKEDRRFKIEIWLKEAKQFHNSSSLLKGTFTFDASDIDGEILKKMANQVAAKCGRE